MSFQCNFCNSKLATELSLSYHQKTTKKCIIKQGLQPEYKFKCDICKETFIRKSVLNTHILSCGKKNKVELNTQIIIDLNNENALLKTILLQFESKYNILESKYNMVLEDKEKLLDKITTSALSKTNTTNKNIVNITYTRTDEELKNIYEENLNTSHIEGGISAITKLIVDKVVTNDNGIKMISITDKSRGTARYRLPSGENVIDNGLTNFTKKNRNILMKKIYSITSGDQEISKQILDEDTNISKGYMEISGDLEGDNLKSSLIKSI
jgi:hypothetical protein